MGNSTNKSLHAAKDAKEDEFYTQLSDIEKEVKHYKDHFKDKVVFCNCDDPEMSNFFRYFNLNFNHLGLKKLISTHFQTDMKSYALIMERQSDGEVPEVVHHTLSQNGDFRSPESIEYLKEADIVVTNPPFSLFREYIAQLMEYNKTFLIIGNQNALTYKEIFPLIKDNKMWLGYKSGDMAFKVPDYFEPRKTRYWQDETGQKWRSMGNICWFTNLDIKKRHEDLVLYKKYSDNPDDYQEFDNYNAINVNKVVDIPTDYTGMMGVPITFLDKYNPDQFELLGITQRNDDPYKIKKYTKDEYKNANDLNARGCIIVDGVPKSIYPRILIKHKHPQTTP